MSTERKLQDIRYLIEKYNIDGYIQPLNDAYMSEYPPACNRRIEWLCGFSGSAGTVVVLPGAAAFFTDGRYTLQAQNEVDSKFFTSFNSGVQSPEQWLATQMRPGQRLGYDPTLYTRDGLARIQKILHAKGIECVAVDNLVDRAWKDRPAAPDSPVTVLDIGYSGEAAAAKRKRIGEAIAAACADAAVLATPESVNWLLNIRGRDIEHTPVVLAVALMDTQGSVKLYIDLSRCDGYVRRHLGGMVEICEPALLEPDLQKMGMMGLRVLCDPQSTPLWYSMVLQAAGATVVDGADPCIMAKAIKNAGELRGIRDAHIRDGAAVSRLLCWLDGEAPRRQVSELEVCEKLLQLRMQQTSFLEPSFATISGSGANGAIVHYRATQSSDRALKNGELFLLDSGGQYPDGTTDITRTVPIGVPTAEHKDRFTRVLKGHIAIATAQFPQGTGGSQIDAFARQYLWQAGLDYDHGTGHGVGHFLGVHEGPQRISKRGGDTPLQPNMIVSNEPGYYKEGAYGIRIENLVVVIEKAKGESGKAYYGFETLTCVPIDTRLVDAALLTTQEKDWLNQYHRWVQEKLSANLDDGERQWLAARCAAI
jgi:Xaa-Pro aminopeptidase